MKNLWFKGSLLLVLIIGVFGIPTQAFADMKTGSHQSLAGIVASASTPESPVAIDVLGGGAAEEGVLLADNSSEPPAISPTVDVVLAPVPVPVAVPDAVVAPTVDVVNTPDVVQPTDIVVTDTPAATTTDVVVTETKIAETVATDVVAAPVAPETTEEASATADKLVKAVQSGNWPLALGALIMLLVFGLDKVFKLRTYLTNPSTLKWFAVGTGVVVQIAAGLMGSLDWGTVVLGGGTTGLVGIGLWELVGKAILGDKKTA
jgi:hypothetical protein